MLREEVAQVLAERLRIAVMRDGSTVDVRSIRNPAAWSRHYLRGFASGVIADVSKRYTAELTTDPESTEPEEDTDLGEHDLAQKIYRAHGIARQRIAATHIREQLALPELVTPDSKHTRELLLSTLTARPDRFLESLERHIYGEAPRWSGDLLWGSYSPDHAETLLGVDLRIARILIADALAPRSRPGRDALRDHRRALKEASSRRGWPSLVDRLQAAWLSEFFAEHADHGRKSAAPVPAPEWVSAVTEAITFPGAPLGTTVREVQRSLDSQLDRSHRP